MARLTLNDIEKLISDDESRYLELKETTGEIVKGMCSGCAFLNSNGGWLFFGVTNKLKIVGQQVTDSTKREIANHLKKFEPAINIAVQYIEIPNKAHFYVIAIHFDHKEFTQSPYTYDGRAYYKLESTTTLMPREMYNEKLRKMYPSHYSWEKLPAKNVAIEDLDEEQMVRTIQDGVNKGRIPALAIRNLTPMDILSSLDLSEDGSICNSAVVLFGKHPRKTFVQCCLRLARFEGVTVNEFRDQKVCEGNLFDQLDEAMTFCQKHMFLAGSMDTLERIDTLTVPYRALREAIINLLCHRSWERSEATPSIAIFDDRIELDNPGSFPMGYTWEYFSEKNRSLPHNPDIAQVFYKRGLLESWGRGIQLIIKECKDAGMPEPTFTVDHSFVTLTIRFKSALAPRGVNNGVNNGVEKLGDNYLSIYDFIKKDKAITTKELSDTLGIPFRTVQRILTKLRTEGYIKREGTKNGTWKILQ